MSKIPKQLVPAFVAWARSKGIGRPYSQEAMDFLEARFLMEVAAGNVAVSPVPVAAAGGVPTVLGADRLGTAIHKPFELAWDGAKTEILDVRTKEPDDFDVMIEQREQALIDGGHDDLARDAILMQDGAAARAAIAPPSNTNPASATNTPLGGQATPDSRKPPVEVARWVGDDSEATNFTVTAALVIPTTGAGNNASVTNNAFLQVQWGVRGFTFNMQVDIGTGCEFTLAGSFVSVAIGTDPGISEFVSQPMVAGVAFREGNRTAPLTRTLRNYVGGLASAAIPPFAKKFFVVAASGTATVAITLQEPDGTVVATLTVAAGNLVTGSYIIPPGATIINWTPSVAAAQIIFELNV